MGSSGLITEDKSKVESTSLSQFFEKQCPIYMSYGMSYKDFWHGDAYEVSFYKKAYKLKLQQQDENNWMIGMYVYEAIIDCSPTLHPFSHNRKPLQYAEKPFLFDKLNETQKNEKELEQEQENERLKFVVQMNNWFHATAKQFNKE